MSASAACASPRSQHSHYSCRRHFPADCRRSHASHAVTWDERSLKIDSARVFIWSGEFHPFAAEPDLCATSAKMKAVGYNTVTCYIPWGYYTPARVYDFTGIRDVDLVRGWPKRLASMSSSVPDVVNAELTRGGFPSWLVNQKPSRTDDPEYLKRR